MKEFIEQEKERLQALFAEFNRQGSWIEMRERGEEPIRLGMVDSYTVTRVAPHFNASGEMTHADFWLLFKMAGYDQGFQFSHTIKVCRWEQDDTYLIDLSDNRDRRFHVELIMDVAEAEMIKDWKAWQKYKAANRERFDLADRDILAEHIRIAEEWE